MMNIKEYNKCDVAGSTPCSAPRARGIPRDSRSGGRSGCRGSAKGPSEPGRRLVLHTHRPRASRSSLCRAMWQWAVDLLEKNNLDAAQRARRSSFDREGSPSASSRAAAVAEDKPQVQSPSLAPPPAENRESTSDVRRRSVRFAAPEQVDTTATRQALKELLSRPDLLEGEESVELRGLVRGINAALAEREGTGAVPSWAEDEPHIVAREVLTNVQSKSQRVSLELQHRELHQTAAQALKGIGMAAAAIASETASLRKKEQARLRRLRSPSKEEMAAPEPGQQLATGAASSAAQQRQQLVQRLQQRQRQQQPARSSDDEDEGSFKSEARATARGKEVISPESHVREVASTVY